MVPRPEQVGGRERRNEELAVTLKVFGDNKARLQEEMTRK